MKIKIFFIICTLGISVAASAANYKIECENPLLDRIEATLPTFRQGFDYSATKRMYRGVAIPQFDYIKMFRYLFHDPFIFSSGLMIETGATATTPLAGTWKEDPNADEEQQMKAFLDRWNSTISMASQVNQFQVESGRSVWLQRSYGEYNNTSTLYHWVQFVSDLYSTAVGYARTEGGMVLGMDIPMARINPSYRTSDKATIIPVLIAPWEVTDVSFNTFNINFKKIFSSDSGTENRCEVDGLEVKIGAASNGPNLATATAYLSLCDAEEACLQDMSLLPAVLSPLSASIKSFRFGDYRLQISKEVPSSTSRVCGKTNLYQSLADLQNYVKGRSEASRAARLTRIVRLLSKEKKPICEKELNQSLEFWKQLSDASWNELLEIGLFQKDPAVITHALGLVLQQEDSYLSFEDILESYAIKQTRLTRKGLVRKVLAILVSATEKDQSPKLIARLKEYLKRR